MDHLSGLVVRVPGYRTEVYCVSCEVRTEFICYVEICHADHVAPSIRRSWH
jgi:hypothetical protein